VTGTTRPLRSPLLWSAFALLGACGLAAARADEPTAPIGPSQVRRLSEAQYRNTIADLFGPDIKVVGRFEPDMRGNGLLAVGSSAVSVSPSGFDQYEEIARGIAAQVTDKEHRAAQVGCEPGPADPKGLACARRFAEKFGLQLFRRPLASAEAAAWAQRAVQSGEALGNYDAGLAAVLAGMLTDPRFLFRIDMPGRDRVAIDGYSRAARLSYLLWDTTPDAELLEAARAGRLDSPEGLSAQVDRMIASARFAGGVRAFFTDFLRLDEIETLSKDALIFPAFSSSVANATREQTLRTITDLLIDHDGDYRDLFTTRRFAMTKALGPIYDIPIARDGWYMHEFPQGDPRAGLLTQASLLALHSHPGRTSPTLRGKALREVLLCETIPTPPANVNFAVVQDVNNPTLKTTRARLQAHLDDEECASCHRRTDPIGLGLEQFDGAGQFRTRENGETIDIRSQFDKVDFDGAAALGRLLHDDEAASTCLVKSVWRYANGRDAGDADTPSLEALTKHFAGDGHRFPALLRSIATDPAFYAFPATPRRSPRQVAASRITESSR